jgi:LPXTG-site transpeptidase (sortase) family protein
VTAGWDNFTLSGGTGVVRFQATVLSLPAQGGVTNTAAVEWTSLPGDPGQISPHNDLSTERFYDPGDPANTYGVEASFTINALIRGAALPNSGFPPGLVTKIGAEPQGLYYSQNDLTLEIPALKVNLPVMGIPLKNGTWDLTWLSRQAGWLEGTAYPTFDGNSIITAHVYLPNGLPGPFIDLGKLSKGQEVAIVSNGLRYIYQVREVKNIKPDDMSVFKHEEKSWLTLLTCKEYDEKTNSYRSRHVVRAVLLRIESLS